MCMSGKYCRLAQPAALAVRSMLFKDMHDPVQNPPTMLQDRSTVLYVDNCLHSLPCPLEAKELISKLRDVLSTRGFDIRQWASNVQSVVDHLPPQAQANSTERWLSHGWIDAT